MRILFTAAEIAARVEALAAEIARMLPAEFVMVGLLKGAAVFVADLARALDGAGACPEIEFMRLASYGSAKESSGVVQLIGDVPANLAGRPVLLIDDIFDTGHSIAYAAAALRRCQVGKLWTCALLDKPQRRQIEFALDFVGFRSPTCSSSAMASTTPKSIAICPISASSSKRRLSARRRRPYPRTSPSRAQD